MLTECPTCNAFVDAVILQSFENHCDPEDGPPSKYNFASCPKCSNPLIIGQTDWGRGWEDEWRVHPPQNRMSNSIPEDIRLAYDEALACNRARAHTATAIMCRKTAEALCAAHGVKEANLAASLNKLKEQGIIENRLFEWADALRLAGNEAVHEVGVTVSPEDANDLLEFTKALLEYVFTFRDRFTAFQKRRGKRTRPSKER